MIALVLRVVHLPTLLFCLVYLKSLNWILIWEACLLLTPGPILLLMGGIVNLADKLQLKFCPTTLPPRCRFRPIHLAWQICLYPPGSHPEEVSFTLWATPNPDPIWLGEIFITPNRTFLLEWCPTNLLWIILEEGIIIPDRAMVLTRTLDGLQFLKHNLSRELGARCCNPISLFWPCLICQTCIS